ncbi:hypothetical protein K504DRAFT_62430 [Pleomassaria siparia CBS 279.74]|uniref:Uncharacterized protein n=1 Tax=Pleomassaria siparia CBS 279.74 TaxID=1314801 RepID=A0A6G1K2D8_9PLEO|nr:hypothetical protein K504DRAFT_62430 [Pleomassaria siparia CBS 279.74]
MSDRTTVQLTGARGGLEDSKSRGKSMGGDAGWSLVVDGVRRAREEEEQEEEQSRRMKKKRRSRVEQRERERAGKQTGKASTHTRMHARTYPSGQSTRVESVAPAANNNYLYN